MASVAVESLPSGEGPWDYSQSPTWDYIEDSLDDFMHRCTDVNGVAIRAPLALVMADGLRSDLKQRGLEELQDPGQLKSKTQLDAITWLAWNDLWYYHDSRTIEVTATEGPKIIRQEEFSAAERLLDDIETYHVSFAGRPELAYDELLDIFHTARLIVKNPSGMTASEKGVDGVALAQKLAIYQTINSLRALGYPEARRPNLQEKDKKIDVVIPVGKHFQRDIALRLQPGSQKLGRLEAKATRGLLFVDLPYSNVKERPFAMSYEDRSALAWGVKEMLSRSLALKFGAEVVGAAAA